MTMPKEIEDLLESVLGVFFSDVRHRYRAAFILCDELVEMSCKVRAKEHNYKFNMHCGFNAAWKAPGVSLDPNGIGRLVQSSRNTRNTLQHADPATTVDDEHCADAMLTAVEVLEHCWPGSKGSLRPWVRTALRVVHLYSRRGDRVKRVDFEDGMRRAMWRLDRRQPRVNEMLIEPGRRSFWLVPMVSDAAQLTELMDELQLPHP